MNNDPDLCAQAVRYASAGIRVFPCRPHDKPPLIPRDKGGQGCHDATTDQNRIKSWWSHCPEANIGVATGHGFFVLDVDVSDERNGEATLAAWEREGKVLPPTVETITPSGGRHLWFRVPEGLTVRNNGPNAPAGIDWRGLGGYVLVPGSDVKGRRYEWSVDAQDDYGRWRPVADPPPWLVDIIKTSAAAPKVDWMALIERDVAKGQRDVVLTSLAGKLFRRLGRQDAALAAACVYALNDSRCKPPLPAHQVDKILTSIAEAETRRRKGR